MLKRLLMMMMLAGGLLLVPSEAAAQVTCTTYPSGGTIVALCDDAGQFFESCPSDGDGFGLGSCGQNIFLNIINNETVNATCDSGYYEDWSGNPYKTSGGWVLGITCTPYGGTCCEEYSVVEGGKGGSMPSKPSAFRLLVRGLKLIINR